MKWEIPRQGSGQQLAWAFLNDEADLPCVLRELWCHLLKGARKGRQKSRTNTWDRLLEVWLAPPARLRPRTHSTT